MGRISYRQVRHIFFDLDHTLWDYERNSDETMQQLFSHYLPRMSREVNYRDFIGTYEAHNSRLWKRYRENKIDAGTMRRIRWYITFQELKVDIEDWVDQMGLEYIEISPRKPHLLPNTIEVLQELGQRFPLHIISNGFSDIQAIKMQSSGLSPFFGQVICPEDAGVKKPDPAIFHHALKAAGADPATSLHIGDSYEADVLGAMKVNMPAIFFNSRKQDNLDGVPEITNLRELLAMLDQV